MVEQQLQQAQEGIATFKSSIELIHAVKQKYACPSFSSLFSFATIDIESREVQDAISDYPLVKQINAARTNIYSTLHEIDRMHDVPAKREELLRRLEANEDTLADIHDELVALETRKKLALEQAKDMPRERAALNQIFRGTEIIRDHVMKRVFRTMSSVIRVAIESPAELVQCLMVIEREENMDAAGRAPLGYMGEALELMQAAVDATFKSGFADVDLDDVGATLEAARFVTDDLSNVLDYVVPCFPPRYDIFNFYTREYHRQMYRWFCYYPGKLMAADVEGDIRGADLAPMDIQALVVWVEQYESRLNALGVTNLQPSFDDGMGKLTAHYVTLVKDLMSESLGNLIAVDILSTQEDGSVQTASGMYVTGAPVDLFQMLSQYLDVVKESSSGAFLLKVLNGCLEVLRKYQEKMDSIMKNHSDQLDPLYLCATINNNNRMMDYLQDLGDSIAGQLRPPFDAQVDVEEISLGFQRVARTATVQVIGRVFSDLSESFEQLFTDAWYFGSGGTSMIDDVVATFQEFFEVVFRDHIAEFYFRKLVVESLVRTAETYLRQLLSGRPQSLKMKEFLESDRMETDEILLKGFYARLLGDRAKVLHAQLGFMSMVRNAFMCQDPDEMVIPFAQLIDSYPEMQLSQFEQIVCLRNDWTKVQVKEAMAICREHHRKYPPKASAASDGLFVRAGKP